jgi:5,6,7,8-tetrahydromethanopterin hydro-lyase
VAEGTVPEAGVDGQLLIAAVWVNPDATDERLVFENNRHAALEALRAGRAGRPAVAEALAVRHAPSNAYYSG